MCDPVMITGSFGSLPSRRPMMLPAVSVCTTSPACTVTLRRDVRAACDISRAEGDAADTYYGVGAEFRQFGDVLLQPLVLAVKVSLSPEARSDAWAAQRNTKRVR